MQKENEIRVDFLSCPENVSFARMTIAAFLLPLDPTLEELGDIKTAVSEAVTNAVVHGYQDCAGMVRMHAFLDREGTISVEIIDNGCGIADVEKARKPFFSDDGEERAGMGFLVMESFMDSVDVISEPGEGTKVILRKQLGLRPAAAL